MNIDLWIAVPAIWTPDMEGEEIQHEVKQMLHRSQVAAQFLQGELSLEDYLDCLNDQRIDVTSCVKDWLNRVSYA